MRRFLLSLGCIYAAIALLMLGSIFIEAPVGTTVGGALVCLAVGTLLSAPYVLAPPAQRTSISFWVLPLNLWLLAQMLRIAIWTEEQGLSAA